MTSISHVLHGLHVVSDYGAVKHDSQNESEDDLGSPRTQTSNVSLAHTIQDMINDTLTLNGDNCSLRGLGGTTTVPNQIFNLIKNIVVSDVVATNNNNLLGDSPAFH